MPERRLSIFNGVPGDDTFARFLSLNDEHKKLLLNASENVKMSY